MFLVVVAYSFVKKLEIVVVKDTHFLFLFRDHCSLHANVINVKPELGIPVLQFSPCGSVVNECVRVASRCANTHLDC